MRDILAGGSFESVQDMPAQVVVQLRAERASRRRIGRRPVARRRQTPAVVAVQPGQLVSPHLKFGFPSLLTH